MDKDSAIRTLYENRRAAHQTLFRHRHPDPTPPFHDELIKEWHDSWLQRIFMVFRGGGKSTISEEAFIIRAIFKEFKNGLILGESETRAIERLASIKHEVETNENISSVFGSLIGPVWKETKIVLSNGVCIQAVGSGQSLRGIKHLTYRPDCILVDDVEGDKDAFTPEQRAKTRSWFLSVVIPVLAPNSLIRIAATPLDIESLPLILAKTSSWKTLTIPIKSVDPELGQWVSSWPQRYPLTWIDGRENEYRATGSLSEFNREFMCQAVVESERIFLPQYFKTEVMQQSLHPVYVMYDPARTVNQKTSSMTGKAVWSWISGRLVVWESGGSFWKPDEIMDDIFNTARTYRPVAIGIEIDGLEDFITQPLRHKMVETSCPLPVYPMRAPRSKRDFIKSLQPYFKAGEVIFVGDRHEILKEQLLNFPRGLIDVPNALAYALILKPGIPVYGEFTQAHISGSLVSRAAEPIWCVLNADSENCTVQVFQFFGGRVKLLFDGVQEGSRGECVPQLLKQVALEYAKPVRVMAPPRHFKPHDVLGLRAACSSAKVVCRTGGDIVKGGEEFRRMLRAENLFQVSMRAGWSIRALQGGYSSESQPGIGYYSLLAEGIEAFAGRLAFVLEEHSANIRMETTPDGRQYQSARAY